MINLRDLPKHWHVGRQLAIVEGKAPPPEDSAYRRLDDIDRARFTLQFKPGDEGNNGYLICCYANPIGETGPWSKPLKFWII